MTATVVLGWEHPQLGRVEEPLCPQHVGVVMEALDALGHGYTGAHGIEAQPCSRCFYAGRPIRAWLKSFAAVAA